MEGITENRTELFELLKNNKGLTLVELMIVMVLSLLVMGAAYMSFQVQHSTSESQAQVSLVQNDLRAAMYNISKDLRTAGAQTKFGMQSFSGTIPVITTLVATSNSSGIDRITLYSDTQGNPDGSPDFMTDDPGEHILYRLNGTTLERVDFSSINSVMAIARNVTRFSLTYYSCDDTGTMTEIPVGSLPGNEKEVTLVRVDISIRSNKTDPDTGQYVTRSMGRMVMLRNGALERNRNN